MIGYQYFFEAFRKYAVFKGRARRAEYWYFVLFEIISLFSIGLLGNLGGLGDMTVSLIGIAFLASIIPYLALTVRRLHDSGHSGTYYFVGFIPIVGGIWLLFLYCTDSVPGENKYGPNPKGIGNKNENFDKMIEEIGQNQ
jgi:uncharacterized membrane protein YhaH (DUF805 family)